MMIILVGVDTVVPVFGWEESVIMEMVIVIVWEGSVVMEMVVVLTGGVAEEARLGCVPAVT